MYLVRGRLAVFLVLMLIYLLISNIEGVRYFFLRVEYTNAVGVITDFDEHYYHGSYSASADVEYTYKEEVKHARDMLGMHGDFEGKTIDFYVTDNGYRYRSGAWMENNGEFFVIWVAGIILELCLFAMKGR